jgi:hypothetical protein
MRSDDRLQLADLLFGAAPLAPRRRAAIANPVTELGPSPDTSDSAIAARFLRSSRLRSVPKLHTLAPSTAQGLQLARRLRDLMS